MRFSRLHYAETVHQPHLHFIDSVTKNNSEIFQFLDGLPHLDGMKNIIIQNDIQN